MSSPFVDRPLNNRPKVTPDQKRRWNDEAAAYANNGGGGVKQFLTDYARNAGQLGGGAVDVAGGALSVPFAAAADGINNGARALLGAENSNPSMYRQQSYRAVNGGLDKITDVANRGAAGARDLLGWKQARENPIPTTNQTPLSQVNNNAETVAMTPQQQANYNYYNGGSQPTSVNGVRKLLTDNIPSFTNVKPQFDKDGNDVSSPLTVNSIPSFSTNKQKSNPQAQQIPMYDQGTQVNVIEDSTTGGYYQRRKADNKNKKTRELLNNAGKEAWGMNRQAILDNGALKNQSEARRLLSMQADKAQRVNGLEETIANTKLPQQQRMAALQLRSILGGEEKRQNNVVTKVTEEMPDGSKRERAVTIDPTTGEQVGSNTRQVSRSYISKLAKDRGATEDDVINSLKSMGNIEII